jgi:3-phosphoshikimate 1-carboxyvinyltransferase
MVKNIHLPKQHRKIHKRITTIPGDKSISHRAVILGSLAEGTSHFTNVLFSEDCINTITIFQDLGVTITTDPINHHMTITGVGLQGLKQPQKVLDVGNSGTGIRLISGVLAGQTFTSQITGDASIQKRPMKRIADPLSQMGATIIGETAPLKIIGKKPLNSIQYNSPVASAQVKSSILFAGLYADGPTTVTEPQLSRDHTERFMKAYGINLHQENLTVTITPPYKLTPPSTEPIPIPSDFSSAAFWIVFSLITPNTELELTNIGLNPTRATLLEILQKMGGNIEVIPDQNQLEPTGTIRVKTSHLTNIPIKKDWIPFIIDEIPILAVAGLFADGTLSIRNAKELRVKESDRIQGIINLVQAIGGTIQETEDGFDLSPLINPKNFTMNSLGDHRLAMSAFIAALAAGVEAEIQDVACIQTSFPNFFQIAKECEIDFQ